MSKKNEVVALTEAQLAILNDSYPVSDEGVKLVLPRLGMLSKDMIEESGTGKNKKITVVQPAGTFFIERDQNEIDEKTGKKVWTKKFIDGETIEVIISYHRRQLRKFDSSLKKYISTPIFDNAEQVVPLYLDKQIIKKGTQAELQSLYPALTQKGKPTSDLKEGVILYVIYNGEMYQMNLSQSSKWEFKSYTSGLNPSAVVTVLGSVEDTFGTNTYRKVTFTKDRMINGEEFEVVTKGQAVIKEKVEADQKFYSGSNLIEAPVEDKENIDDEDKENIDVEDKENIDDFVNKFKTK